MSVQVRAVSDRSGQCRSGRCNDHNCDDRKRYWVEIVVQGVIYRTSAPNLQAALGLAHSATVALGVLDE